MTIRKITVLLLFIAPSLCLAQTDTLKSYLFGHSLLDHRPPMYPTPSDETTVPHWLYHLATSAGENYTATGQYGFLPSHAANLPPIANWGYQDLPPAWDSDQEPFTAAQFSNVILTAANFIQDTDVSDPHPIDASTTVVNATTTLINWVRGQQNDIKIYLYENWPEMPVFPLDTNQWNTYHDYTQEGFHQWWINYQDSIIDDMNNGNVKIIPVGPIMSKLLTETNLSSIPQDSLYEDNAPHGRPNIYFLAACICYTAIYASPIPTGYQVPDLIHSVIRENITFISNFIWDELQTYTFDNGTSRVFFEDLVASDIQLDQTSINLYPNPTPDQVTISGNLSAYKIDILNSNGTLYEQLNSSTSTITIDLSNLPNGMYFLRIENLSNTKVCMQKILKQD